MKLETLTKLFSLQEPWAIGCREAVSEKPEVVAEAPNTLEYPYFAKRGEAGSAFVVIGDNLEQCIETVLLGQPAEMVEIKEGTTPEQAKVEGA